MNNMMKKLLLYVITLACGGAMSACDNTTGNTTDLRTQAFSNRETSLTADAEKAVNDRPITLTTSCLPLVSGKGRIGIWGRGRSENTHWYLESPFRDTIETEFDPDTAAFIYIPVDYVANSPFSRSWVVQLQTNVAYTFYVSALLDSVYVSDSAKMYHVSSDVAIRYSPGGYGYNRIGASGDHLILDP
jgi:hypothetical protein